MTISEYLERQNTKNSSMLGKLNELAKYQSSAWTKADWATAAATWNKTELSKYQNIFNTPVFAQFMERETLIEKAMYPLNRLLEQENRLKNSFSPLRELAEQANRFQAALDYTSRFSEIGSIAAEVQKRMPGLAFQNIGKMFDSFRGIEIGAVDFENFSFVSPLPDENGIETQIIVDESSRIKRIITDVSKDISTLRVIGHRDFEKMVAELLRDKGYNVELTKQTRDGGYDIIALYRISGMNPLKYLVECKHWNNKVNVSVVRSFTTVFQREDGNRGLIVTSSYFTKDAHEERKKFTPYSLELKDRDDLVDWVRSYSGIYVRS